MFHVGQFLNKNKRLKLTHCLLWFLPGDFILKWQSTKKGINEFIPWVFIRVI